MNISRNEFESALREFWQLPEGATEQQMEGAALIAIAVESHPELRSVLQRSVQNNTQAPAFVMKAVFLKQGLSTEREFDQWVSGMPNVARGTEQTPRRKWWQFWKPDTNPIVESTSMQQPAGDDLLTCPICAAKMKPDNYDRHKSKCKMTHQMPQEEIDLREQELTKQRDERLKLKESQRMEREESERIRKDRKAAGECMMCGKTLGMFDRVCGREQHRHCTVFQRGASAEHSERQTSGPKRGRVAKTPAANLMNARPSEKARAALTKALRIAEATTSEGGARKALFEIMQLLTAEAPLERVGKTICDDLADKHGSALFASLVAVRKELQDSLCGKPDEDPPNVGVEQMIRRRGGTVLVRDGKDILEVRFMGGSITDDDLRLLVPERRIRSLLLFGCSGISDAGLQYIGQLVNLIALDLQGTSVGDEGLQHLEGLVKLRQLSLFNTSVSDEGMKHLRGLNNLQQLGVHNTGVSDDGIAELRRHIPGLQKVLT